MHLIQSELLADYTDLNHIKTKPSHTEVSFMNPPLL